MPGGALKGHIVTKETRRKISLSNGMLGKIPWNKGKTGVYSEDTIRKMRENSKGRVAWNKGKKGYKTHPCSEETKRKIGEVNKVSLRGNIPWNKGLKGIVKAWNKGIPNLNFRGENNPNWNGGKSFEIYSVDWTRTLKISIRERDKYTCQLCKEKQDDEALAIHHIDYDKKNCCPENLISLCRSCHMKTGHHRDYWKSYFLNKV